KPMLFLTATPLLTLFLVIGLGYLLGQVSVFSFRLGVAGVLFAGLVIGAFCPNLAVPSIMGTFGLVLFVYSMGLQSGPDFFSNLRTRGARYAGLALVVLLSGLGMALVWSRVLHLTREQAAGLFTGAATNTPALGVILQIAHNSLPAETYSIAYPFGVIGVLLCFHFSKIISHQTVVSFMPNVTIFERNFRISNPAVHGKTVGELHTEHGEMGFRVSRIQHDGKQSPASLDARLSLDDQIVAIGSDESLKQAEALLGAVAPTRLEIDRRDVDYRRIIVSSKRVVGNSIGQLLHEMPVACSITRLRRGDEDIVPTLDMCINYGDRLRVVANREALRVVSRYLGDSIRGTAEMNFACVGFGLVLGALVGMIPIPIPGFGALQLGFGGGPLVVALILGRLGRTGPFTWAIPASANFTLRQLGLLLFMAVVGINSGSGFVQTFAKNGPMFLLAGACITLSVTIPALLIGYKLLRIPFAELLGVVSGIHTESAAVGFASRMTSSERPEVGYASVYPVALILKVIFVQIIFRVVPF
ncbi:MAG: aspartate:alanine exchanger family transporter, partial [Acidobacteriaceae bacterium]|nr:aspartate:alanine exchanger family transporter [Acidobacteriaceae bacterium]